MPTRGRKPKTRAQKERAGNPGNRPLNDREPEYELKAPRCPSHLPAEAKAEWKRRVPELAKAAAISPCHIAVLCAYCEAWARYVKASKHVQEFGEVIMSPKTKTIYASPYLHILTAAEKQMVAYATELGITPSSQTRIVSGKLRGGSGKSGKEKFFKPRIAKMG
ncbi:hypothetical protein LCGC14_0336090 [marine sediment metagenome]|uniref:Phage terminase small subunit P27 family n=1 Tax=marine sediment metagenome TaxID=412755 RepID=A0A0F9TKF8_9ZZZZ